MSLDRSLTFIVQIVQNALFVSQQSLSATQLYRLVQVLVGFNMDTYENYRPVQLSPPPVMD